MLKTTSCRTSYIPERKEATALSSYSKLSFAWRSMHTAALKSDHGKTASSDATELQASVPEMLGVS